MAVEICSETSSMGASPRISFSHDLSQTEGVPIEQYIRTTSSSSIDFDFCVFRESFDQESSSADELFSDGKILPIEIKRKLGPSSPSKSSTSSSSEATPTPISAQTPQPSSDDHDIVDPIKSPKSDKTSSEKRRGVSESDEKPNGKSFWRFKRSSSLNCGSGYARSLCPLPLLNRSNSTGSTPNVKRSSSGKDSNLSNKQNSLKQSQSALSAGGYQKPPLKKSYGSYGNGVKVTPFLNVPSPSMFGLGSIFSPGKDKSKKK
ncbi:unnamed protein product [Coffea canephora]|uniref:Uncharacterized protein n=2 Tax=Coffea TaxID=13442 RepID=A0A068U2K3_COFCA|nr:uncharacterized protein LOC113699451 [Coffea arabica]CDP02770.1 unnamed protein product [Coffea canephora]